MNCSAERVAELEAAIAHLQIEDSGSVETRSESNGWNGGSLELHVVVYDSLTEGRTVLTLTGVGIARDEMDGLAEELADALSAYEVKLYAGRNEDDEDWPRCRCAQVGGSRTPAGAGV